MLRWNFLDEYYTIGLPQRRMLEALVLPSPQREKSFNAWIDTADFAAMDFTTMRLVPALLAKHRGIVANRKRLLPMESIYRYYHLRSSLILAAGRRVLKRLSDAGIDFLLFKGIAIALKYHKNFVTRPMTDIDILLRRESIPQAEDILRQCGFKYGYPLEKKSMDLHSHDYIDTNGSGLDLHWYSLYESIRPGIDDDIWARAEFFDWDGLVVKVMAPEDLLLTSIVNGVRDMPTPPQWIHDVATIVKSEPAILWKTIWKESKKRGLHDAVFHALGLVRGISKEIIPDALLDTILEDDPEFYRDLLKATIAEGRTHGLDHARRDEMEAILLYGEQDLPVRKKDTAYSEVANAPHAPRHIRYFLNKDNAIEKLFLQFHHLPLLPELFEVSDHHALKGIVAIYAKTGEGYLNIPPGLLTLKVNPIPSVYSARIVVTGGLRELLLAPGEFAELSVEVENDSPCCWHVSDGSDKRFGVSYHLLSDAGQLLMWDMPRAHLPVGRKGYVAFIEPAQKLYCKLRVFTPSKPGRYGVQLDIVHELVDWFSHRGIKFPCIDLEIRDRSSLGCYAVNRPGVVHETIGQETVIIDTVNGTYYSTNGYGSLIWYAIADGHRASQIISAFASAGIFPTDREAAEQFIARLLSENLIAASDSNRAEPRGALKLAKFPEAALPVLTKHANLQELIRMHPVRKASAHEGWPYRDNLPA